MKFHKLHGLGNDFVLLDGRVGHDGVALPCEDEVKKMGCRKTGIGFDQLIYLSEKSSVPQYQFFNADGSEAEQCGNGQRALALYLHKTGWTQWPVNVQGLGGKVSLEFLNEDVVRVTLFVKVMADMRGVGYAVNVGNPHWVKSVSGLDEVDWDEVTLEAKPHFPDGVNVELVERVSDEAMRIRINERGVGETAACGSGACAAAWAGHLYYGMASTVKVDMPGGALTIECEVNRDRITLIGPARYVYQGEVEL